MHRENAKATRPVWTDEPRTPLPLQVVKAVARTLLPSKLFDLCRLLAIDVAWYLKYLRRDTWYVNAPMYLEAVKGKAGLEIGGPSWLWKTAVPIYRVIGKLDNVNWAPVTLNNPPMNDGRGEFRWHLLRRGSNLICEADQVRAADSSYDFLISAEVLEHIANPLKTLREWKRVLRPGGTLICEVPNKDFTFDYRRPVTTLEHILDDDARNVGHDDLTHVDEVAELTDDFRNPRHKSKEELRAICEDNLNNRLMHHHVFDRTLLVAVVERAGFDVLDSADYGRGHLVLARSRK
jgi:hypothetical protein